MATDALQPPPAYLKLMHRYETRTLPDLYRMTDNKKCDPFSDDYRAIRRHQENASKAARIFDDHVTEKFVRDYLDDKLEIGCLCALSGAVSRESETYSLSHQQWLDEMRQTKWAWDRAGEEEHKHTKFERLMRSLSDLQRLARKFVPE